DLMADGGSPHESFERHEHRCVGVVVPGLLRAAHERRPGEPFNLSFLLPRVDDRAPPAGVTDLPAGGLLLDRTGRIVLVQRAGTLSAEVTALVAAGVRLTDL